MQNLELIFIATQTCILFNNVDKLGPHNLFLYFFSRCNATTSHPSASTARIPCTFTFCFPLLYSFHSSNCTITKFMKENDIAKLMIPCYTPQVHQSPLRQHDDASAHVRESVHVGEFATSS
jgi:hypothetical protein